MLFPYASWSQRTEKKWTWFEDVLWNVLIMVGFLGRPQNARKDVGTTVEQGFSTSVLLTFGARQSFVAGLTYAL